MASKLTNIQWIRTGSLPYWKLMYNIVAQIIILLTINKEEIKLKLLNYFVLSLVSFICLIKKNSMSWKFRIGQKKSHTWAINPKCPFCQVHEIKHNIVHLSEAWQIELPKKITVIFVFWPKIFSKDDLKFRNKLSFYKWENSYFSHRTINSFPRI